MVFVRSHHLDKLGVILGMMGLIAAASALGKLWRLESELKRSGVLK